MTDYISRADAIEELMKLPTDTIHSHFDDGYSLGIKHAIRKITTLPSADAVDCTDFIEWLVDRVLDETIWENNSVAYGEIICRKLVKLGVLEATEEPSYYIRPSADAKQGEWILAEERPPEFPCLVCDANGNQPSVPMGIVTITDEEYGEWYIDGRLWDSPKVFVDGEWGNRIAYGNRIIAWQPLPKPYKGGDDE